MQVRRALSRFPILKLMGPYLDLMRELAETFREFDVRLEEGGTVLTVSATALRSKGDLTAVFSSIIERHLGEVTDDLDELLDSPDPED